MSQDHNNDIPQEAFDWYDEYAHGGMDRRTFISKLGTLAEDKGNKPHFLKNGQVW